MGLNLNRATLSLDPLNVAIIAKVEEASLAKHANDQPREYLGASLIGDECLRKIQFEWMTGASFPARVRSIFARGHYFEHESRAARRRRIPVRARARETRLRHGRRNDGRPRRWNHPQRAGRRRSRDPAVWEAKVSTRRTSAPSNGTGSPKSFRGTQPRSDSTSVSRPPQSGPGHDLNADTCERLHFTVPFDAASPRRRSTAP